MAFFADLLLALHIVCTGVSASGPLICGWLEWREARGDAYAGRVGRRLLALAISLLFVGGLLGAAAGCILWNEGLHESLRRLPSKAYYGVWELLFSVVLMTGHWIWWRQQPRLSMALRWVRIAIAFFAGTNLLYHFPVLFVVITDLVHRGETLNAVITNREFRQHLVEARNLSRVVHVMLASLAAGSVALMACAVRASDEAHGRDVQGVYEHDVDQHRVDRRGIAWGARLAVVVTLAQIPVGLWVVTALSPLAQQRLLGGDLLAGVFFVIGLAAALAVAHLLTAMALGEHDGKRLRWTILIMSVTLISMTLTSRRIMAPASRTHARPSREVAAVASIHDDEPRDRPAVMSSLPVAGD